ncbi:GNAT family N-acetyltransferase [Lysobacter solisilvae (ex Woo and Kim 2020)]|uniref:GNAT family N-acetyltransferase n=1 Tax=Agrilutibacter terrestris TaxID=2865112 RepID=A0A7H0FVV3_9GAMM|nr:GNAT family N-acetyltransferase [Lysobacter terrestris]QNP40169.1 GNAT family N-acetyltransferase [Lysobacter terrestris]
MEITIRPGIEADAPAISGLIIGLSHFYIADPASPDAQDFLATLAPEAVSARITAPNFRHYVAMDDTQLCGFAAVRDGSHLYHLFVRSDLHGRGLARALWLRILADLEGVERFTVNSSLFAVPVYERLGFVATAAPQTDAVPAFVSMAYRRGS